MKLFTYMCICLVLTIVIEIVISLILGIENKKDLLNVILVNILTNPLLVAIVNLINFTTENIILSYVILFILEIIAIAIEGLIYKKYLKYNKVSGIRLSIILNICSYFIGYFILSLIGY